MYYKVIRVRQKSSVGKSICFENYCIWVDKPNIYVKSQPHLYFGGGKRIPGAYWLLASLAFSERPWLKRIRQTTTYKHVSLYSKKSVFLLLIKETDWDHCWKTQSTCRLVACYLHNNPKGLIYKMLPHLFWEHCGKEDGRIIRVRRSGTLLWYVSSSNLRTYTHNFS